ncbi:MAG: hypothetical protein ACM3WV_02075 [Bacillota bacterium]
MPIHVGGKYEDHEAALGRFRESFTSLTEALKPRLALENDDRSYSADEVPRLCRELHIPMVLDLHHAAILPDGTDIYGLLPEVFATWGASRPKMHLSSPRSSKEPRSHADFVDPDAAARLLRTAGTIGVGFDIMLEAKQKDLALLEFSADLKARGFPLPETGIIEM